MNQLLEHIEKHPSETQRLLGLSYDQLIGLITHASSLYDRQQKAASSQKMRIIKPVGGRPPKQAIAEPILLTLVYLHHRRNFQMLGIQLGVSESAANYIFHR